MLNMIHDTVAEKAYSRKLEMEADSVGLLYLSKAGYNPHALLDLWEIMAVVEWVLDFPVLPSASGSRAQADVH